MMKMKLHFIPVLLVILTFFSCSSDDEPGPEVINRVQVGDRVPAFTVSDDQGNTFSSEQFIGKRSLLVFFHTGCGDCQRELPLAQQAYAELSAEEGYQVITIARAESANRVNQYWTENGFTMPKYLDPDRSVYSLFANSMVPRFYIIDSEGKVTWMAVERTNVTAEQLIDLIRNS